ncbi:unnamed protein product [Lactuca saligna]|uniref:Uncharacterized protein n=1 Tax=Lactuca saligna TaxID=75948 RepID=A0AA36EM85_LACSI|nr:unnamed protein product [Lactuca saligna]
MDCVSFVGTMDRGNAVVNGGVSGAGTSGLLSNKKLKAELELPDSEGSLEPTTPLNLSERDEEDEDVESEVEPNENPEEDPEEDPNEEPEEDPAEEPEVNHMEYHVEQRYKTFHMPYVEYTPTSLGTYWERLYKDEMPQAQLEIHNLKRKMEEIDENRSRIVQENRIRVEVAEKSKSKIQRLEQEVLELRKPTMAKLWEGFVSRAKQVKAATYRFLDRVLGRDPPQAEVLVIQSGPSDLNVSSRRFGRFTRVTPEDEQIPIGAYVRAPGDVPETPLIPNASRGRGQGRVRGRGGGRGAVTTSIPAQSAHGSFRSHHGRGRGLGRGCAVGF